MNCATSLCGGDGAADAIVFINSRNMSGSVTYLTSEQLKVGLLTLSSNLGHFIKQCSQQMGGEFRWKLLDLEVFECDHED